MDSKKEWAIKALQEDNFGFLDRDYVEALANETLPKYYHDIFGFFRLHSDDLPKKGLVGEWHPHYPLMKCRGNVIIGISLSLRGAVTDGVFTEPDDLSVVEYFRNYNWTFQTGAKGEVWTSRYEIEFINTTLDFAMSRIRERYGVKHDQESVQKKFFDELKRRRESYPKT